MIPEKPKDFDPRSKEGDVFNALSKLPDDYYVFHSYTVVDVNNKNDFIERELDFVVANPKKGVLCIEVKAGSNIYYHGRDWFYSSGKKMPHGGPYHQIASAKRVLVEKIRYNKNTDIQALFHRCKVMHAVMFPDMLKADFEKLVGLPEEACVEITICAEDLVNPTKKIAEIFSYKLPWEKYIGPEQTKLSDDEFKLLLDGVLCPHFNLIPSPSVKNVFLGERMNQLLREQYRILDFLEEQDSAVINGAAGTGKTMIAVEKARRNSLNGEKVLFLCYNRMLCQDLINRYKDSPIKSYRKQFDKVEFMTISKLAKEITGKYSDYNNLLLWLNDCVDKTKTFPYEHVIIDEGQDFGLIDKETNFDNPSGKDATSIIDALKDAVLEIGGTFYLFYDKYQMIQGNDEIDYILPMCIEDADCKLTLHSNCRNTKEIAKTSVTTLKDKKNKAIKAISACSWDEPIIPTIHLVQSNDAAIKALNNTLDKLSKDGLMDVVILTSESLYTSILRDLIDVNDRSEASYNYKEIDYKVTTCKKFKGLEADAIVYIDLNKNSFSGRKGLEFYVGTSRAKLQLEMICMLSEEDYCEVVQELDKNAPQNNNPSRMRHVIGSIFNSSVVIG